MLRRKKYRDAVHTHRLRIAFTTLRLFASARSPITFHHIPSSATDTLFLLSKNYLVHTAFSCFSFWLAFPFSLHLSNSLYAYLCALPCNKVLNSPGHITLSFLCTNLWASYLTWKPRGKKRFRNQRQAQIKKKKIETHKESKRNRNLGFLRPHCSVVLVTWAFNFIWVPCESLLAPVIHFLFVDEWNVLLIPIFIFLLGEQK